MRKCDYFFKNKAVLTAEKIISQNEKVINLLHNTFSNSIPI